MGRENGIIGEYAYQATIGLIALTLLLGPLVVWAVGRVAGGAGAARPAGSG